MNRAAYKWLFLFAGLLASCASQPSVEPASTSTPAVPETEYVKTGSGQFIKKSGWEIPHSKPGKNPPKTQRIQIGHQWAIQVRTDVSPDDKISIKVPSSVDRSMLDYAVSVITEISGEGGQKPFCYQLKVTRILPGSGNAEGMPTFISFLDDDGDGNFETLTDRCTVPGWVK